MGIFGRVHNGVLNNDYHTTWDDLIAPYLGKEYPDWSSNPWGSGWAGYNLKGLSGNNVLVCGADRDRLLGEDQGYFKRSYSVPIADCDGPAVNGDLSWTMFAGYIVGGSNPWPPTTSSFRSFKLSEAKDATGTLLLVERHTDQNYQGNINTTTGVQCRYTLQQYCIGNDGSETPVTFNGAHSGKWNYLFVDGHVDTLAAKETWGRNPFTGNLGNDRWWSYGPWTRRTDD